jgi:hypothetical protein
LWKPGGNTGGWGKGGERLLLQIEPCHKGAVPRRTESKNTEQKTADSIQQKIEDRQQAVMRFFEFFFLNKEYNIAYNIE